MGENRFAIVKATCRRCGCDLYTGNHSLVGANHLKAELDRICVRCITPAEDSRILEGQAAAILREAGA